MPVKKNNNPTTLEEYMSLPYKIMINSTGETGYTAFFAEILELEGCCADGATPNEAYNTLRDEMAAHLKMYLNKGITPPMPKSITNRKVKVLVRMPAALQQRLAVTAKTENISINQLIIDKLSSV